MLDTSVRSEPGIIKYLKREFGREIVTKSPWKVIPHNKKLRLSELIALVRYHYWETWVRLEWPQLKHHWRIKLLADFRSQLIQRPYG